MLGLLRQHGISLPVTRFMSETRLYSHRRPAEECAARASCMSDFPDSERKGGRFLYD